MAKKVTKKASKPSAKPSAKAPAKSSAKASKPAAKPAAKSAAKPAAKKPAVKAASKASKGPASKPAKKAAPPAKKPAGKPVNKAASAPARAPANPPAAKPAKAPKPAPAPAPVVEAQPAATGFVAISGTPPKKTPIDESRAFAIEAARLLSDDKCTDIVVLDVTKLTSVSDFIVIGTGTSDRQMRSVLDDVAELGAASGNSIVRRSVDDRATWVLADFVDVVVHLFEPNTRAYYDLEMMWGDAPKVPWERAPGEKPPVRNQRVVAAPQPQPDHFDDDATDGDESDDMPEE
jgi:ribosome-associated protein